MDDRRPTDAALAALGDAVMLNAGVGGPDITPEAGAAAAVLWGHRKDLIEYAEGLLALAPGGPLAAAPDPGNAVPRIRDVASAALHLHIRAARLFGARIGVDVSHYFRRLKADPVIGPALDLMTGADPAEVLVDAYPGRPVPTASEVADAMIANYRPALAHAYRTAPPQVKT